jgi:hypothetical protein
MKAGIQERKYYYLVYWSKDVDPKWCLCPKCDVKQLKDLRNNKYFRIFCKKNYFSWTFRENYLIT